MKVKDLFKPATVLVIAASAGSWQWAIASDQLMVQPGEDYLAKGLLDSIPLWGLFLLTVTFVMASLWLGRLVGRKRTEKTEGAVGIVVGAVLSLLAFLLAFTFNIASNRFDARKQVLLDEVESIGTTYLRAGLLSEPQGGEIRQHLREYVDVRLGEGIHRPANLVAVHAKTMQLHDEMWSKATALVAAGHKSVIDALFIDSLNQTIDLHNRRAATVFLYRVPDMVWISLMLASMISMTMVGYLFGIAGDSGDWLLSLALALIFSVVITLTSALDRPMVRVNQGPMIELQKSIRASEQPSDGSLTSRSGM